MSDICSSIIFFTYNDEKNSKEGSLLKTGIIVSIGLAIHNFPEGLAIGSGFESSIKWSATWMLIRPLPVFTTG